MQQIDAPYNFVPLSSKVVFPEWGDKVSHDLPFKDGLSGELELTVKAESPILIGGEQTQGNGNRAGSVRFFKTPDDRYAIPGSSIRGVVRSVLEISTFSKMNRIDDKRYGLRDISGKYVSESYRDRVQNNLEYGFLELNKDGKPAITPCEMIRLSHRDLENWWSKSKPIFEKKAHKTVQNKYQHWAQLCKNNGIKNPDSIPFDIDDKNITSIGSGKLTGFPVLTGQISDATIDRQDKKGKWRRGKYKDFMFYSERPKDVFTLDNIDKAAWRDFLFIHGDEDGKPDMSWPGYWKEQFWNNKKVPVFYIKSKGRLQIGLAYMPKLAGDFTVHDLLQHTDKDHLDDTKDDFSSLLFGKVGEDPEQALKGRVYFEPAILEGTAEVNNNPQATILNGAKPSYFPNYIYQKTDKDGSELAQGNKRQYATYVHSSGNPAPELRGWKRYPVRPDNEVTVQTLSGDQIRNTKVQTELHNLSKGSEFKGRLVFHNLKPEELGSLLWSIQMDGNRHSIGMAKSFGYGQICITVNWEKSSIHCNDPEQQPKNSAVDYIKDFQSCMDKELNTEWKSSPSIKALRLMTDVDSRGEFNGNLKHMVMGMGRGKNDFVTAKQNAFVLAPYIKDERKLKPRSHVAIKLAPTNNPNAPDKTAQSSKTGYFKKNLRNGSVFLELSGNMVANATNKEKVAKLIESLPTQQQSILKTGKGFKVVANLIGKEIDSIKLWEKT